MSDHETWVDADHANTLNAFDVGDTRTTHAIVASGSAIPSGEKDEIIAFYPTGGSQNGFWDTSGVSPTIKVGSGVGASNGIAIVDVASTLQARGKTGGHSVGAEMAAGGHLIPFDTNFSNQASPGGSTSPTLDTRGTHGVAEGMTVRRLTPVECERLMGWPDGWTAPDGVKASDSKRYAACGDGIVAPVAFWIADRIRMIEEEEEAS